MSKTLSKDTQIAILLQHAARNSDGQMKEAVRRHLFTLEVVCVCAAIGALVALVLAEVVRG